jgi:hypothetical protein
MVMDDILGLDGDFKNSGKNYNTVKGTPWQRA